MNPKAGLINTGLVLFSFIVLTSMPTFGYAKNVYQPENTRVSSAVVGTTALPQVQLAPNAALSWSLELVGDQSSLIVERLRENMMLLAQETPKSEAKKPKAETGKIGDKSSDASKKDEDGEDDEDEDEDDEEDQDDGEKDKGSVTKEDKIKKGPKP